MESVKRKIYRVTVSRSESNLRKTGGHVRMTTTVSISPREQYFTSIMLIYKAINEQTPINEADSLDVFQKWNYDALKRNIRKWGDMLIFSFERGLGRGVSEKYKVEIYGFEVNPDKLDY